MNPLTTAEIAQIFKRPGEKRYNYFIKAVMESEEVYGLADEEGWVILEDDKDNSEVIPFFPSPQFARAFRDAADLEGNEVEPLDLYEFIEWLEDFKEEGIKIGVFLNTEMNGAIMDPLQLKADFQIEFDKEKGE